MLALGINGKKTLLIYTAFIYINKFSPFFLKFDSLCNFTLHCRLYHQNILEMFVKPKLKWNETVNWKQINFQLSYWQQNLTFSTWMMQCEKYCSKFLPKPRRTLALIDAPVPFQSVQTLTGSPSESWQTMWLEENCVGGQLTRGKREEEGAW